MKISPKRATYNQICKMHRDHTDFADFSLMTDGFQVWLSEQRVGHERTQHIAIPKRVFNRLLVWYEKESECVGRK